MSLFIDRSLRQSLREVVEWEKQNPEIARRDEIAAARRAEKAKAELVQLASMATTHAPKTKKKAKL
jgi:hypothetical protein